ncbi:hypothetical protein KM043_001189 [Ampulex compressa]|nr:hypothetical protein KM043_001189 [Ampulex compressa]
MIRKLNIGFWTPCAIFSQLNQRSIAPTCHGGNVICVFWRGKYADEEDVESFSGTLLAALIILSGDEPIFLGYSGSH